MFTAKDAKRFCAGLTLTSEQEAEWLKIANQAFDQATKVGADTLEAELGAIRSANAMFRKNSKDLSEKGDPTKHQFELVLAEVGATPSDDFQQVLPIGYWFNRWYGDLIITKTFCERIVDNWQNKVLGNREPFLDTNHDGGAANAWAIALEARDDGLYVKWDWTDQGRDLVMRKIYKYYSASIDDALDIKTGNKVWPVLISTTLTNQPAMNTLPEAHLSDDKDAHGDVPNESANADDKENTMELADVLTFAKTAKEAEREILLSTLAPELKTKVEALQATNISLTERLTKLEAEKKTEQRNRVIKLAVDSGRILAKDKAEWEKRYDSAPSVVTEILETIPPAVDLSEHGKDTHTPATIVLSDDEKRVAKAFGQTEEEYTSGKPATSAKKE